MFGKGGGPLSIWLKEFCQLVFIQTLQAFLYAMSINMIVKIRLVSTSSKVTDITDRNTALGLICVVILTSIFKVEDLVRKIFGFGETKADHKGAMASLIRTKIALDLGKNVLDNGKKLFGGAGKLIGGANEQRKNRIKKKEALDKNEESYKRKQSLFNKKNNDAHEETDEKDYVSEIAKEEQNRQRIQKEREGVTDPMYKEKYEKEIEESEKRIEKLRAAKKAQKNATANNNTNTGKGMDSNSALKLEDYKDKYEERKKAIEDEYDKKKAETSKKKREGLKTMTKGVVETGGAVVGLTTGAIIGGADGDIKEAVQGGISGMGVGDRLGGSVVNTVASPIEFAIDTKANVKTISKSIDKSAKLYEKQLSSELYKSFGDLDDVQKDVVNDVLKNVSKKRASVSYMLDTDVELGIKNDKINVVNISNKQLRTIGHRELSKITDVDDID